MGLIVLLLAGLAMTRPWLRGGQRPDAPGLAATTPTNALMAESGVYLVTGDGHYLIWG